MYRNYGKRLIGFLLSLCGMIVLAPVYLLVSVLIVVDDPGPVFFAQKRVGRDKNGERSYFQLYKFRSMKMSTPRDMPTHMLENPEQYITRVGRFLRRSSLDELPQIWNILKGDMAIVGPRPALWNQYDLLEERDRYGANAVRPGLTGWAQINGRDELEIDVKARFDGDYVRILNGGGWNAFRMDVRCFFGTIAPTLRGDGVLEGGTGELKKQQDEAKEKQ